MTQPPDFPQDVQSPIQQQPLGRPYADSVTAYALAGWSCILPVPPATKTPPPKGFTGAEGRDTDPMTLVEFCGQHHAGCGSRCDLHGRGDYSVALRMPEDVIGIDVDAYAKGTVQKHGDVTLAAHLELWGPLPATWSSTARGQDQVSRIYFFRVPAQRYATILRTTGTATAPSTADVEIIQRHHRYAVVAPSFHHDANAYYAWYDPSGQPSNRVPSPAELPALPEAWVAGLAEGAAQASAASADHHSGQVLLDQLGDDIRPECSEITSAKQQALAQLEAADAGSRHDTMTGRVHQLVQLASSGHTGIGLALLEVREAWAKATAGEDRDDELERMLLTSARKAVTVVGAHQVPRDPCLFGGLTGYAAAPAPDAVDENGEPLPSIAPPRWWSIRQEIGVGAFDPLAQLDQPLAEAVLERTFPVLRYASDAGAWLLKGPESWESIKDLADWAVAQVAPLMPVGNPQAEKGSDDHARSARRARFNTAAGAGAVAKKIKALVAAGTHPVAVRIGDLDSDPEILWAGGVPWSLRFSDTVPVAAEHIDAATPHLKAAGTLPELRATPLWDAFLEAVWPDPEIRAWALRVLSIALTGYSDRALPILLGETGRGKTQVITLLMSLLGSYAHAADPRLISPAGERAHASIVFALKGRRFSFIDEAPRDNRDAQERLKQLTGGGELTANAMNQNPITFRPTHTLVLTANDEPTLTDPATRSRVRLIPCEGDPELVRETRAAIGPLGGPTWRTEAPGVLAKMMAEAAAWLNDPTSALVTAAPESIRHLAENLGAEQDPVMVWLSEETEYSEEGTASRELYQAFVASCRRNSMRADLIPTETKWGRTLTRLGYRSEHTDHGKRRPLRIRQNGGFIPGSAPERPTATTFLTGSLNSDGLLTGSETNPSEAKPQVNPRLFINPDGLTGSPPAYAHTRTRTHAHETPMQIPPNPSGEPASEEAKTAPDLRKQPIEPPIQTRQDAPLGDSSLFEIPESASEQSEPPTPEPDPEQGDPPARKPRTTKPKTPEQIAKAAAVKAEKLRAAIDEASGEIFELPAMVTRNGTITSITADQAGELLATITSAGQDLTVDVETSGYPVGHRHFALRTAQLGNEHFAAVLDVNDDDQREVIAEHLAAAAVLHAHSASADLVPLAHAGLLVNGIDDAWERMADTVIPAKLADPASTGSDPGLKKLAPAVLGREGPTAATTPEADEARAALFKAGKWLTETKVTTPLERSGWAQVDSRSETMIRYAASDVLDDAALASRLPVLEPEQSLRENLAQRMTARVADRGLRVDGDHVQELMAQQRANLGDATGRLTAFGIENPGSDQQVAAAVERQGLILPRTPSGKPSVAKGAIEQHSLIEGPLGDLIRARLDYQEAENRLGLFLEHYEQAVLYGDGRVRPTVYTLGADTGRMSCVRPNLQQVPREGGFRACITADPGHLLISADFASVELRVAAALSQDQNLMAILADPDRDVHAEISRIVWGPDATKAHRYQAKRKVFGRLYGSGLNGLVTATPPVSPAIAQSIIDAMDQMTPGLTEWSRLVRDSVTSGRTQFRTYAGRIVHMPKLAPHAGPNYCIQGTARELLIDALVRWSQTRWGDATLLPVHDEIVAMVPEDEAADANAALVECMTSEIYGVPIIAEASEPSFAWKDSA